MNAETSGTSFHPGESEKLFLNLAYNRFYELFDSMMSDEFLGLPDSERFWVIVNLFAIFTEATKYEPLEWTIQQIRRRRPPGEAEIASDVIRFTRHLLAHFPLFDRWNDVWISGELATWDGRPGYIQKFLSDYALHPPFKFRFWEADKRRMTYAQVNFPGSYHPKNKVYLNSLIDEGKGSRLCAAIMKGILDTQVEPNAPRDMNVEEERNA